MYIKYKIASLVKKTTSIGKDKADVTLIDSEGNEEERVTIWSDFPNFATLKVGDEVMGALTIKVNGQYTNKTLYPERTQGWGGGKKQPSINISKMMDKKAETIKEAQERKNDSIAYFNSINVAIQFVSEFKAELDPLKDAYTLVLEYRDMFLAEWQKYEADATKGKNPF